jgi:hypothetical protein
MKNKSQIIILGLCAAAALFAGTSASAQISLTGTTPYTQNFSSMGTGTTLPTGWSAVSEAGTNNTFAPNVTGNDNGGTAPLDENFTVSTPTATPVEVLTPTQGSSTGKGVDAVNYVNSAADIAAGEGTRSLGTDPSGNAATILELSLTNNTGSTLNALNLSYDIDRFTTTVDGNGVSASAPNHGVEEFPGYHLFYNLTPSNNATWVDVTSLDPTPDAGTVAGAVNVPNTVGITAIPTTTVALGAGVANGTTFALAWFDDNGYSPSPDQEIGLNNIVIAAAPEPSSLALGAVAVCLLAVMIRRHRIA